MRKHREFESPPSRSLGVWSNRTTLIWLIRDRGAIPRSSTNCFQSWQKASSIELMRILILSIWSALLGSSAADTPEVALKDYRQKRDLAIDSPISCIEKDGQAICEYDLYYYLCYSSGTSSCGRGGWSCISLDPDIPPSWLSP